MLEFVITFCKTFCELLLFVVLIGLAVGWFVLLIWLFHNNHFIIGILLGIATVAFVITLEEYSDN